MAPHKPIHPWPARSQFRLIPTTVKNVFSPFRRGFKLLYTYNLCCALAAMWCAAGAWSVNFVLRPKSLGLLGPVYIQCAHIVPPDENYTCTDGNVLCSCPPFATWSASTHERMQLRLNTHTLVHTNTSAHTQTCRAHRHTQSFIIDNDHSSCTCTLSYCEQRAGGQTEILHIYTHSYTQIH